jgi:uncharacterized protein
MKIVIKAISIALSIITIQNVYSMIEQPSDAKALFDAVKEGDKGKLEQFLKHGADFHIKAKNGNTLLHAAAVFGRTDLVPFLLSAGINPNTKNNEGQTQLHIAVLFGRADIVPLLLNAKANPRIKNNQGKTPEDLIGSYGKSLGGRVVSEQRVKEITEAMRKSFKDFYDLEEKQRQQLWKAIQDNDVAMVKQIMQQGPIKEFRDDKGNTPLHRAVDAGNKDIVGLILLHNKDLARVPNKAGQTSIERAIASNKWDILELFRRLGFSEAKSK